MVCIAHTGLDIKINRLMTHYYGGISNLRIPAAIEKKFKKGWGKNVLTSGRGSLWNQIFTVLEFPLCRFHEFFLSLKKFSGKRRWQCWRWCLWGTRTRRSHCCSWRRRRRSCSCCSCTWRRRRRWWRRQHPPTDSLFCSCERAPFKGRRDLKTDCFDFTDFSRKTTPWLMMVIYRSCPFRQHSLEEFQARIFLYRISLNNLWGY